MNHNSAHTALVKAILVAVCTRPKCLAFEMKNGAATDPRGNFFRFGTKGMADIEALVRDRHLWIEAKTGTGKQTVEQIRFAAAIERIAGPGHYIVARSVEDALRAVDALLGAP